MYIMNLDMYFDMYFAGFIRVILKAPYIYLAFRII